MTKDFPGAKKFTINAELAVLCLYKGNKFPAITLRMVARGR